MSQKCVFWNNLSQCQYYSIISPSPKSVCLIYPALKVSAFILFCAFLALITRSPSSKASRPPASLFQWEKQMGQRLCSMLRGFTTFCLCLSGLYRAALKAQALCISDKRSDSPEQRRLLLHIPPNFTQPHRQCTALLHTSKLQQSSLNYWHLN